MWFILVLDWVVDVFKNEFVEVVLGYEFVVLCGDVLEGVFLELVEIVCFFWDVFLLWMWFFFGVVSRCFNLKWFYIMSVGVDDLFF